MTTILSPLTQDTEAGGVTYFLEHLVSMRSFNKPFQNIRSQILSQRCVSHYTSLQSILGAWEMLTMWKEEAKS